MRSSVATVQVICRDLTELFFWWIGYTQTINLLNYSSVAIPVTKADQQLDPIDSSYTPLNKDDELNWDACRFSHSMVKEITAMYARLTFLTPLDDPEIYHGGPVGVQVVARKFEEEKALAIAGVVLATLAANSPT